MTEPTTLTPLYRQALLAGLHSQRHQFHRTRGGYLPITGERTAFTTRTIRAMERDGLVEFRDQFDEYASLTRDGVAAASRLQDAHVAKAGGA